MNKVSFENQLAYSSFFENIPGELKDLFAECDLLEVLSSLPSFLSSLSLGKIKSEVPKGTHIENPETVYIGSNVLIEPSAYIKGPCWISDHCQVRHGAYIRENFYAGPYSVIGHDTELKNSIFLTRANAAHFAYVGDSILGNSVNLGAGVKIANLKLNHASIEVDWEGAKIKTGKRKLGAIIGDGVQVGCNSVINPGTLIGKEALIYPLTLVSGTIKKGQRIKK
jgi:UDP-N-acetylglucosamine diphosphorylase / glucose-1-phosphate thymidylyltransferase / UDP-N-acetylgalactosamine diphosphorylase / glucosamine-1-phosphate N-acetyltransferase / galactosamine-1-phosphate N-acetyltransferase